jgi:ferredoxin-nitrite reductase
VTIAIPLGDLSSSELLLFADLADRYGDGFITITRDQDLTMRNVAVEHVPKIRDAIAPRGLGLLAEHPGALLRACTGAAVCALGITRAPDGAKQLADLVSLARNSSLRVHVSGCPNSCAQHQVADIGLAGTRLRVEGRTTDGYQLFVGSDPEGGQVGEVVGRVAERDLPAAIDAVIGVWESTRSAGETIGRTARRVGLDAFTAYVAAVLEDRWATASQELMAYAAS